MLEEREPFALDSLTQYQIEQDLLGKALAGMDLEKELPLILASGQLPHGHCGTDQLSQAVQRYGSVRRHRCQACQWQASSAGDGRHGRSGTGR